MAYLILWLMENLSSKALGIHLPVIDNIYFAIVLIK